MEVGFFHGSELRIGVYMLNAWRRNWRQLKIHPQVVAGQWAGFLETGVSWCYWRYCWVDAEDA